MRYLLLILAALCQLPADAQLTIYGVGDPATAAVQHLSGPNVLLSNAYSQTITPQQIGVFSDSTASMGLDSGLVISTGIVHGLVGPNNIPNLTAGGGFQAYDAEIATMSPLYPGTMFDPGIVVMDLVPAGDTLEVTYVFGSEEYDEYACSDKDDRFGLFLSGPGIQGPFTNGAVNIARLPISNLPITVNTLNRGMAGAQGNLGLCNMNPGWLMDTIYYINNDFGLNTQLDAYSVVLTARTIVQPGALYQLKIAIADINDGNFDSAVFFPEGGIRCSDLSTNAQDLGDLHAPGLWVQDGLVLARGLNDGDPVQFEVFDPTGRLLLRTNAVRHGAIWCVPLSSTFNGMVLLRATQGAQVVTGKVFVR